MTKILLIEDNPDILRGLRDNLTFEGYQVLSETDGRKGLALALTEDADLIILDVMLPGINGFDILKALRADDVRAPVIMLTAKGEEVDKVLGLELGADDYVTKPFGLHELLARVRAVLRRFQQAEAGVGQRYAFDAQVIHFDRCELTRGEERVELTDRETEILRHFVRHRGKVVSREELLSAVWGYAHFPSTRTVDNQIVALRKKLGADYITTVRGRGYKFDHG